MSCRRRRVDCGGAALGRGLSAFRRCGLRGSAAAGVLLFDESGTFAEAVAQVGQLGTADTAFAFDLDPFHARRMEREDALDTLTITDTANGEGGIQTAATASDDDARKNLDTFLVTFHDFGVDAHGVADLEWGWLFPKLFGFNFVKQCLAHKFILSPVFATGPGAAVLS